MLYVQKVSIRNHTTLDLRHLRPLYCLQERSSKHDSAPASPPLDLMSQNCSLVLKEPSALSRKVS